MALSWRERIGTLGVWRGFRVIGPTLARQIEDLGYGAVWQGGSPEAHLREAEQLLESTESLTIATGIVNIWKADPSELAESYHRINGRFPGRLLVGIGTGHREATPERVKPLDAMSRYLDVLDERGVPLEDRLLSALGPRMLAMAAERSAGTHPYLTVPEQTAQMRKVLGPEALIAPEQTLVFDSEPGTARRTARAFLDHYLELSNYTSNMQRAGFSTQDVAKPGSDRLVDAIVPHGAGAELARAVQAHLDAGADHVCVQIQPADGDIVPALQALAGELDLATHRRSN
jgi:probable F420-dependent oxidoreductase